MNVHLKNFFKLAACIGVPVLAGYTGSLFTEAGLVSWYMTLEKPDFHPPGWVFRPVWTVLYILMGVAAFIVWKEGSNNPKVREAIGFFFVHLIFNIGWSFIFFGLQSPGGALLVIVLLILFIIGLIFLFGKVHTVAAVLLIPYLLWTCFAASINLTIWIIN